MYDFVTTRLPLTPEEQKKAKAILELMERQSHTVTLGKGGWSQSEGQAFLAFKKQFYNSIAQRLAMPSELDGTWGISEDGEWLVITQIKEVD